MSRALDRGALFVLLSVLIVQVLGFIGVSSPTVDEYAHHLPSGVSYWATGDFRMNPASPPLSRMIPALPVFLKGAKAPTDHPSWETNDSPEFARQFFNVKNPGRQQDFVFWSRVPVLCLSAFFALALYLWTKRLAGPVAGFCALYLYVFSPNILAHSGLGTADLAVAFFYFLSVISFWSYLRAPSKLAAVRTGFLAGAALLSKYSAILLFPTLLGIWLLSGARHAVRRTHAVLFSLALFLTLWAGYFFEFKPLLENTPDPAKKIAFLERAGGEGLVRIAAEFPIPLATFLSGLGSIFFTRAAGTDAFLLGEWSREGWWYYYFTAMAVKETIPLLFLGLVGLLLLRRLGTDRLSVIVLWMPVTLFFAVTLRDKAQAGIRYFLPIFPFLMAAAGILVAKFSALRRRMLTALLIILLGWHALTTVRIAPYYLAYFNEAAGGPSNGENILRDSNIDWGQDLKGLGELSRKNGYAEVVILTHGIEDPSVYGIPYRWPEPDEFATPRATVYALGKHRIDSMRWVRDRQPSAHIGHSMLIYDLRKRTEL